MKLLVATGAVITAILASSVGASNQASLNYMGYGYWCKAPVGGGVACVSMSGKKNSYSVGMHRNFVLVMRGNRIVYRLFQP